MTGTKTRWVAIACLLGMTAVARVAVAQPGDAAAAYAATIGGMDLAPAQRNGQAQASTGVWELWGDGFVETPVTLPASGVYTFTVRAYIKPHGPDGALSEIRIDQIPVAVGAAFSREIRATSPADFRWTGYAAEGPHKVQISLMNHDDPRGPQSLMIKSLTIRAADAPQAGLRLEAGLRPDPPGRRNPALHPYSSYSLWNTPIGAEAVWSGTDDADTIDLRKPGGYINAGAWSMPFYRTDPSQPLTRISIDDETYPMPDVALHLAPDAAPAEGEDRHMIIVDPPNHAMYNLFNCRRVSGGLRCGQSQKDDLCGEALGGYGWGAGVIRAWELRAGRIRHMLRYALPVGATRAGTSWISGLAWPAMRSDYNGPRGLYTGHILYGSTIGLPADVDIGRLGLSPSGLVLARALQEFGAIQRDTGGRGGIRFYAEQDAEGMPQLDEMRGDLDKIVPFLAILRNQAPGHVNGGGARPSRLVEGLDPSICPRVP